MTIRYQSAQEVARSRTLSFDMRSMLVAHIDAAQPFATRGPLLTTARALVSRGLLKTDSPTRPKITTISERGRAVLSYVLADYADALAQAQGLSYPQQPVPPDDFDELDELACRRRAMHARDSALLRGLLRRRRSVRFSAQAAQPAL